MYLIAAALVVIAGTVAVRLARPADPYESIRVDTISDSAAKTERVQWDSERGRGLVDVRESDGAVRRYYMENGGGAGVRVWGGAEVSPEETAGL